MLWWGGGGHSVYVLLHSVRTQFGENSVEIRLYVLGKLSRVVARPHPPPLPQPLTAHSPADAAVC